MKNAILSILDYILCLLAAFEFTSASKYISCGQCKYDLEFLLTLIATFAVFVLAIYGFKWALNNVCKKIFINDNRFSWFSKILEHRYGLVLIAGIMFLIWLPVLLFLYPGTLINDTWGEINQFIDFTTGNGNLFDHHPIFDTLVMGSIIVPVANLTNNWQVAFFVYVIMQAIITCIVFSYTLHYVYNKLKIGSVCAFILFSVYCFLPIFPVSSQTVSKDALFSWMYVLFIVQYFELVRTDGEVLKQHSFIFKLIVLAILCCLSKKVGAYVILLSLFFALLFLRKCRRKLLIAICCTFAFMFIFMPFIKSQLNVVAGGKQEMFSLPFQMSARYVVEHGDDITPEEYEILDAVLGMEDLAQRYDPTNADPVKGYDQRAVAMYYIKYIGVWVKQGLRHPTSYWHATNAMISCWFSWEEFIPLMNMDWHGQLNPNNVPESATVRTGIAATTASAYESFYHNLYNNSFLRTLFTYGFYASLMPLFCVSLILQTLKKDIKYWIVLVPMLLSILLGCWLAPVSICIEGRRYLYPIIYTLPITLTMCIVGYENSRQNLKV